MGAVELVLIGKTLQSNLDSIRNKVFSFLESKAVRHSDKVGSMSTLRSDDSMFLSYHIHSITHTSFPSLPTLKVVLRRSGGRFVDWAASSKPVYLSLDSTEEVWASVVQLLPGLLPGEAALLEGFCPPLKSQATLEVRTWDEYTGKGLWRRSGSSQSVETWDRHSGGKFMFCLTEWR